MIFQSIENEPELLQQLARGHEPAFRHLYEAYAEKVYSVALMHLKVTSAAEDIVQSVFLKLWESRQEVTSLDHFPSWLYTIARNTIISTLRRQGTGDQYKKFLVQRAELAADSPEYLLLRKEQQAIIQQAIAQLSVQQRTAFLLQREEGLTYEAIGQRMGIATNTVRVHLYKAMESIRAYVHAAGGEGIAVMLVLLAALTKK
jgi:RNA polymerase sigma-70 factor (family 1)